MQRLTDNDLDKAVGAVTYTQMLNERGGIECDLTITRVHENRFLIITGTAFGNHDLGWIRKHLPDDGSVYAEDITSSRCCIGLWGPHARKILAQLTREDVSNASFPYMTAKSIPIGNVPVLSTRVTYVGELGWEFYAPMEFGLMLWDTLWEAGQAFGMVAAGYRAIESLRLEKGYRYWSADISPEYNPYEAGLGFCVKLDKGDFIGREALKRAKQQGITRKLCCLTIVDELESVVGSSQARICFGGEPILFNGRAVGRVTSGGYGYCIRKSIAYGYLPVECSTVGNEVTIEIFGELVRAQVEAEPLYDPKGERIRS